MCLPYMKPLKKALFKNKGTHTCTCVCMHAHTHTHTCSESPLQTMKWQENNKILNVDI